MRALLSVYDKTGIVELASELRNLSFDLIASGKTSAALEQAGIEHTEVAVVTGAPEMLGGRVKTLHPAVHGGILADRSDPGHMADLAAQGIVPIDLVVCNLYPFSAQPGIEMIDVGGPTMVRAAAKNHAHVGIVVDPHDYGPIVEEIRSSGWLSDSTRRRLARAAFAHSAAYDAAIVEWLDSGQLLAPTLHLALERAEELRYGENPHQKGARYRVTGKPTWWDRVIQHGGSPLSYLNIFDTDSAWRLVADIHTDTETAVAIIKHANPCGTALASSLADAYRAALECDPVSAFGGVVALGGICSVDVAKVVAEGPQADVVIAAAFEPGAVEVLANRRKSTRLLEAPPHGDSDLSIRSVGGSFLVQEPDSFRSEPKAWQVVTKAAPTPDQWRDVVLAYKVCARTWSNSIVVASAGATPGIGAGQQSRVEAAQIAVRKAGERARGAAAASDAFFPFRDGLDVLAEAGVAVVVQPGGSVRDAELIAAADEHGMSMVFSGERHFRH